MVYWRHWLLGLSLIYSQSIHYLHFRIVALTTIATKRFYSSLDIYAAFTYIMINFENSIWNVRLKHQLDQNLKPSYYSSKFKFLIIRFIKKMQDVSKHS